MQGRDKVGLAVLDEEGTVIGVGGLDVAGSAAIWRSGTVHSFFVFIDVALRSVTARGLARLLRLLLRVHRELARRLVAHSHLEQRLKALQTGIDFGMAGLAFALTGLVLVHAIGRGLG